MAGKIDRKIGLQLICNEQLIYDLNNRLCGTNECENSTIIS